MSADWPLVTIDGLKANSKGSIAIGPFGSRMKSDCYVANGIPVIRGTNITGGRTFDGNFVYITEEKADSLGSSNVYQNDLVFPHRGSIGEVGIVLNNERYVISSSLMKLTCDKTKAIPKFLYYFFKSHLGRHELLKNASQVGTPGIGQPLTSLKGIELRLPPLDIQSHIERVLTSLDNKTQLNTQTNQTLEAIAQAIFKSWFVDFDPVKAKIAVLESGGSAEEAELAAMSVISSLSLEALAELKQSNPDRHQQLTQTAALFPSKMQESELGEIPEGWEKGTLQDVLQFTSERIQVSSLDLDHYISTENMLENRKGITSASNLPTVNTVPAFHKCDILISNIRPYFKKIWLATFNGGRSADVLGFSSLEKKETEFVYNLVYQDRFFEYMMTTSKGAKMPRGDKDAIMKFPFSLPPKDLREKFSKKTKSFYPFIMNLNSEKTYLQELRNTLLPKLLSGEIDLSSLNEETSEANA